MINWIVILKFILNLETMKDVWTTSVGESTIDESPMAYKPMEEIIKYIKDTVEIIDIIKPLYNFKASNWYLCLKNKIPVLA